ERADDDLRRAVLDHLLHVGHASQAPAELHGNLDGADDAPHYFAVLRILVGERAVKVNDVQHARARLLEPARDLNGVAVVDLQLGPTPLRQTHALSVSQINRRNYQHLLESYWLLAKAKDECRKLTANSQQFLLSLLFRCGRRF